MHVVSSVVVVDHTGMKVCVKIGDIRSNRSRDIQLPHTRDERRRIAAFCIETVSGQAEFIIFELLKHMI